MPKLSIGIPVFNGQEFLPELLDSLLAQTFRDFEILICDNASSDRTPQICCEYERHDSRIHYIRNERNLGAIANYNRVFELSTAPLFKWAAHDDLHHEAYLDVCVRLLEENPDIILAHTGTAFIDENSEILPFEQETGSFIDPKTGRRYWPDWRREQVGVVVAAHSAKITVQLAGQSDPRRAAHGYGWPGALAPGSRRTFSQARSRRTSHSK
jgi:glycosyltransferase involved in cell wall biosynthesis